MQAEGGHELFIPHVGGNAAIIQPDVSNLGFEGEDALCSQTLVLEPRTINTGLTSYPTNSIGINQSITALSNAQRTRILT